MGFGCECVVFDMLTVGLRPRDPYGSKNGCGGASAVTTHGVLLLKVLRNEVKTPFVTLYTG